MTIVSKKSYCRSIAVAFSMLFLLSVFLPSCTKEEEERILTLIFSHEDAESINFWRYNFEVIPDTDDVGSLYLTDSQSGGTFLSPDVYQNELVEEGERNEVNYKYVSSKPAVDIEIVVYEGVGSGEQIRRFPLTVEDGDVVTWDSADTAPAINAGSGSSTNGESTGNEDCTNYFYESNQCLSANGGMAAMRYRACKLSETSTQITARVEIEKINGGIDPLPSYAEGVKFFFRGGEQLELSVAEFNQQTTITRTITANKTDIDNQYLDNWQGTGFRAFVEVFCQY